MVLNWNLSNINGVSPCNLLSRIVLSRPASAWILPCFAGHSWESGGVEWIMSIEMGVVRGGRGVILIEMGRGVDRNPFEETIKK